MVGEEESRREEVERASRAEVRSVERRAEEIAFPERNYDYVTLAESKWKDKISALAFIRARRDQGQEREGRGRNEVDRLSPSPKRI